MGDWAESYDTTLNDWGYEAHKRVAGWSSPKLRRPSITSCTRSCDTSSAASLAQPSKWPSVHASRSPFLFDIGGFGCKRALPSLAKVSSLLCLEHFFRRAGLEFDE